VNAGGERLILRAVLDPDGVQLRGIHEGAQLRKHVDDVVRVRRHVASLTLVPALASDKRRARHTVQIVAGIAELVVADVSAQRVAIVTGGRRVEQSSVHIVAHPLADGVGFRESGVIAAGVERGGDIERGSLLSSVMAGPAASTA